MLEKQFKIEGYCSCGTGVSYKCGVVEDWGEGEEAVNKPEK